MAITETTPINIERQVEGQATTMQSYVKPEAIYIPLKCSEQVGECSLPVVCFYGKFA